MTILEFFGLCSLLSMGVVVGIFLTLISLNIIFAIPLLSIFRRRNKKRNLT